MEETQSLNSIMEEIENENDLLNINELNYEEKKESRQIYFRIASNM